MIAIDEAHRRSCSRWFWERRAGQGDRALLRDPTDDYLVVLAREAEAEAVVTSDHDLLDHGSLSPTAINPRTARNCWR